VFGKSSIDNRIAIVELSRVLDVFYVQYTNADRQDIAVREAWEERASLYANGWTVALALFQPDCTELGAPIFPSERDSQEWAHSVLQYCGQIAFAERALDYCRHGLGVLRRLANDAFEVRIGQRRDGVERVEAKAFTWLRGRILATDMPLHESLHREIATIAPLLEQHVDTWGNHYIRYTSEPRIDQHYEQRGMLRSRLLFGYDAFPGHAVFGQLPFGMYRTAVALLVGWSMKHIAFCGALRRRQPNLDLHNLVTIFHPAERLAGYLAGALEITEAEALRVLDVVTLRPEHRDTHCAVGGSPAPPLVMIGKEQIMKSTLGATSNPFFFMLRELQRRYRRDWDRAVDAREAVFRTELYGFFEPERFFVQERRVAIRSGGREITDVDAVIVDRHTGTLGLFQLKWQDPFGNSMRERKSRQKNINTAGQRWVAVVTDWLASGASAAEACGIPPPLKVAAVRLFVLGRNFAQFSDDAEKNDNAAWGAWPNAMRFLMEKCNSHDPLESLYQLLRDETMEGELPMSVPDQTINLKSFSIRLHV